jgi:hypothetical protein
MTSKIRHVELKKTSTEILYFGIGVKVRKRIWLLCSALKSLRSLLGNLNRGSSYLPMVSEKCGSLASLSSERKAAAAMASNKDEWLYT